VNDLDISFAASSGTISESHATAEACAFSGPSAFEDITTPKTSRGAIAKIA
jgi:hypothetical protein